MRLGVLGDPIDHSRSPDLHRAGLAWLGIPGESSALRTTVDELPARLRELEAAGYAGVNLTHPLKEAVLPRLARLSPEATAARSVNTVGFGPGGPWGDTTDGRGFVDLLGSMKRRVAAQRVVILGAGGAARSLARALIASGCGELRVAARDPHRAAEAWSAIAGVTLEAMSSATIAEAARRATLLVNATPVSTATEPLAPTVAHRGATFIDLTYGAKPTAWVLAARAAGAEAVDGLGLLVHQARRSLEIWTGRTVEIEPLARAVGWPE